MALIDPVYATPPDPGEFAEFTSTKEPLWVASSGPGTVTFQSGTAPAGSNPAKFADD